MKHFIKKNDIVSKQTVINKILIYLLTHILACYDLQDIKNDEFYELYLERFNNLSPVKWSNKLLKQYIAEEIYNILFVKILYYNCYKDMYQIIKLPKKYIQDFFETSLSLKKYNNANVFTSNCWTYEEDLLDESFLLYDESNEIINELCCKSEFIMLIKDIDRVLEEENFIENNKYEIITFRNIIKLEELIM
ncbi:MAG: hypothetical protein ACTTGJ_03290 [Clostridium sp.]